MRCYNIERSNTTFVASYHPLCFCISGGRKTVLGKPYRFSSELPKQKCYSSMELCSHRVVAVIAVAVDSYLKRSSFGFALYKKLSNFGVDDFTDDAPVVKSQQWHCPWSRISQPCPCSSPKRGARRQSVQHMRWRYSAPTQFVEPPQ